MAYKLTILEPALQELDKAIEWYLPISELLVQGLLKDYYMALKEMEEHPLHFPLISKKFRKCNLQRFPYKVIYTIKEKEIIVIAFAHHKRRPGYWKNR